MIDGFPVDGNGRTRTGIRAVLCEHVTPRNNTPAGSNRIRAAVEPTARGATVKSFNFGFGGLNPLFQDYLARRIRESFEAEGRELELALIELNPFQTTITQYQRAAASIDAYVGMLATPPEIRQILFENPTRGARMLTIHYLRDDVSAEMATYYFGEFLRPPVPKSDLGEDEAQQERLRELGEKMDEKFEEGVPGLGRRTSPLEGGLTLGAQPSTLPEGRLDPRGSRRPGIDEVNAEVLEVAEIACGEGRPTCRGDAGDLYVTDLDGTPRSTALRRDATGRTGGCKIEDRHPVLEVNFERLGEGLLEKPSASPDRKEIQTIPDFEHRDRSGPDGLRWQGIQPGDDLRVDLPTHQRRQHVRVQQDHDGKSAGRGGWSRSSGISSTRSNVANRSARREPSGALGPPSSRTALRRISLTSSAVLCPCRRARLWSFTLTSSSRSRTRSWAIAHDDIVIASGGPALGHRRG